MRVAVLASGSGSNLQALLDDQQGYRIVLVLADRAGVEALDRAMAAGAPARCVPLHTPRDPAVRRAWEAEVTEAVARSAPDLIVMAGWMRVMSREWVGRFAGRMINQHPALLPDDAGPTFRLADGRSIPAIRGAHAVRDALRLQLPVTGCTIHWVTPEVDVGPVLARAEVPVLPTDDEATLHERIKREERKLIVEVVRRLASSHRSPNPNR
jgi:phosphoribosylglycinamide formyltransferase-1